MGLSMQQKVITKLPTIEYILAYILVSMANFHVMMAGRCEEARLGEQCTPSPREGVAYLLCRIIPLEI